MIFWSGSFLTGELEQVGEIDEAGKEGVLAISRYPQYSLILLKVAVGILQSQLRFADATKSMESHYSDFLELAV